MIDFIIKYWIQFLFVGIVTIITLLLKKVKSYYYSLKATKDGLKVLLKGEIIRRYLIYSNNGCVDIYEQEILNNMYQEYKKLGGNGITDEIIEKLEQLPLKDRCDMKM